MTSDSLVASIRTLLVGTGYFTDGGDVIQRVRKGAKDTRRSSFTFWLHSSESSLDQCHGLLGARKSHEDKRELTHLATLAFSVWHWITFGDRHRS